MRFIRRSSLHKLLLSASVLLASCSTVPKYQKVQLPAYVGSYLSSCSGKDGTVSIELSEAGKVIQIFDADWTSELSGNWGVASYSPLGQTLFQIEYDHAKKNLRKSGQQSENIQKLSVTEKGLLAFDGHEVGLRADEVGCILNHKIPQKWISQIVAHKVDQDSLIYTIQDKDRTITLSLSKHGNRSEYSWKAELEWSLLMGFKKVRLNMGLLRSEQAMILRSDHFENRDCRIVIQEE